MADSVQITPPADAFAKSVATPRTPSNKNTANNGDNITSGGVRVRDDDQLSPPFLEQHKKHKKNNNGQQNKIQTHGGTSAPKNTEDSMSTAKVMKLMGEIRAKLHGQEENNRDIKTLIAQNAEYGRTEREKLSKRINEAEIVAGQLVFRVNAVENVSARTEDRFDAIEDRLERMKRDRDLTFIGVPNEVMNKNADLFDVVLRMAIAVGYGGMKLNNIEFVRRAAKLRNGGQMLIARMETKCVRDQFFTCYMKNQSLNTTCFDYEVAERIFVGDNLTYRNSQVRKLAVHLKKKGLVRQMVVRDGMVFVSLHTDPEFKRWPISSVEELNKLVAERGGQPVSGPQRHMQRGPVNDRLMPPRSAAEKMDDA